MTAAPATRPAREAFLKRFEREVDPDNKLSPDERRRRAEHAKRAYMLHLAKEQRLPNMPTVIHDDVGNVVAGQSRIPSDRSILVGRP